MSVAVIVPVLLPGTCRHYCCNHFNPNGSRTTAPPHLSSCLKRPPCAVPKIYLPSVLMFFVFLFFVCFRFFFRHFCKKKKKSFLLLCFRFVFSSFLQKRKVFCFCVFASSYFRHFCNNKKTTFVYVFFVFFLLYPGARYYPIRAERGQRAYVFFGV